MRKKKSGEKSNDLLADLATKPPEPAPAPTAEVMPRFLEYQPFSSTDKWRVELFELFQAEFALTQPFEKAMPIFHEVGEQYARGWLIAKLLFGITPMIIPEHMDAADMGAKPREAICDKLGIDKPQLQAELDALRTMWQSSVNTAEQELPKPEPKEELQLDITVFKSHGFSEAIFDVSRMDADSKVVIPRSKEESSTERNWFMKRVSDWSKMLSQPMASALVRQALMNELYLRRLETEISMIMPGTKKFSELQKVKNEMEVTYQNQLEQLKAMFPEMNIAGNSSFRACISNLKDGYIEYKSKKSTRLIDRMRTAAEIDVELRQSLQKPEPQYRAGLNIYWIEAMRGLYDPEWRSAIPLRVLKKMDAAGRAAIDAARTALGEPMVDLEQGVSPGEGSQFPDLEEAI